MDERAALAVVEDIVGSAGDDAAIINNTVIATDMLHERADFPDGVDPYTAGWRTVSVSLSDLAAVGAMPIATLSVYSPSRFVSEDLTAYLTGAIDASAAVDATYIGGDLDITDELTTVGIALGEADSIVGRDGATPGDAVVVTGTLGGGAVAVEQFNEGHTDEANARFQIEPRVDAGLTLREDATAMIDSSDGLARSLHLLAEASSCGFEIAEATIPFDDELESMVDSADERREYGLFWGEDFELVATVPPSRVDDLATAITVPLTQIGTVTDGGVTMDGESLPDRGYSHQ